MQAYLASSQFTDNPDARGVPWNYFNGDNICSIRSAESGSFASATATIDSVVDMVKDLGVDVNICTGHSGAIRKKSNADIDKLEDVIKNDKIVISKQQLYDTFF